MAVFVCECGYRKETSNQNIGRKAMCPKCGNFSIVMGGLLPKEEREEGKDNPEPDYDAFAEEANAVCPQPPFVGFVWPIVCFVTIVSTLFFLATNKDTGTSGGENFLIFLFAFFVVAFSCDKMSQIIRRYDGEMKEWKKRNRCLGNTEGKQEKGIR